MNACAKSLSYECPVDFTRHRVMSECHYLVALGNESSNFELSASCISPNLASLGDLLVPLAPSDKRNNVSRTGNEAANIISKCAQDAIDISSFESRIRLLYQL